MEKCEEYLCPKCKGNRLNFRQWMGCDFITTDRRTTYYHVQCDKCGYFNISKTEKGKLRKYRNEKV